MTVVLRVGTAVSTVLLALGMVLTLGVRGSGAGQMALAAGLIILMITPVAHLIVAIADEIAAREWTFVALGLIVLLLLGGSLVVAFS